MRSDTPIVLRRAEDAPRILEAFRAGRLLKQRFPDAECVYRGEDNAPCAIGVVLTDEEAERLPYGHSIDYSIDIGAVDADDPDWFGLVQRAHDDRNWEALEALLTPQDACPTKEDRP